MTIFGARKLNEIVMLFKHKTFTSSTRHIFSYIVTSESATCCSVVVSLHWGHVWSSSQPVQFKFTSLFFLDYILSYPSSYSTKLFINLTIVWDFLLVLASRYYLFLDNDCYCAYTVFHITLNVIVVHEIYVLYSVNVAKNLRRREWNKQNYLQMQNGIFFLIRSRSCMKTLIRE